MTELEKEKLFKLRVQGCDWKYISKELSAPENTLKSYCYRNGLTDNDLAKINECCYCHKPVSQKAKGCAGCGAAFDTVGNKSQRFCSMDCYRKNRCGGAP